ncbi:MAG: hypothetical protein OXE54_01455 [Gammaproteobacteria bacterium]|nr:hypothetical protein [Gammaproteobacteria bacterium]
MVEEVVANNPNFHWLFIDVDGNGDFSIENDMVIKLEGLAGGVAALTSADFSS